MQHLLGKRAGEKGNSPGPKKYEKDDGSDLQSPRSTATADPSDAWTKNLMESLDARESRLMEALDARESRRDEKMMNMMQQMQEATKMELRAEIAEVKEKVLGVDDVKRIVQEECRSNGGGGWAGSGKDGNGGDIKEKRKMEMIIGGFPRDTPRKEIIDQITRIMEDASVTVQDIFTFDKYGSVGVVRFHAGEDKAKFKRYLAKHNLSGDLWAGDNLEKEERTRRRVMGKVKKALAEEAGSGVDVDVDYKRFVVRHKRAVVAQYTLGSLVLSGTALARRERIYELIKEIEGGAQT